MIGYTDRGVPDTKYVVTKELTLEDAAWRTILPPQSCTVRVINMCHPPKMSVPWKREIFGKSDCYNQIQRAKKPIFRSFYENLPKIKAKPRKNRKNDRVINMCHLPKIENFFNFSYFFQSFLNFSFV